METRLDHTEYRSAGSLVLLKNSHLKTRRETKVASKFLIQFSKSYDILAQYPIKEVNERYKYLWHWKQTNMAH